MGYQAACRHHVAGGRHARVRDRVTSEKRPNRAGVVRRMARSGPLALGLDAEVAARLLEGDLQLPAQHEPGQDLRRGRRPGRCRAAPGWRSGPAGSRMSTQRSGTGGRPLWYQTAVSEATSTVRGPSPVPVGDGERGPGGRRVGGARRERRAAARPSRAGGPSAPAGGAGPARRARASRRSRVTTSIGLARRAQRPAARWPHSRCRRRRRSRGRAASAGQRRSSCRAQSVSVLCRRPRCWSCRSEGARVVRNGSAQTRPAQGMRHQQHQAEPAQPADLDEVVLARAHRVAIEPLGRDLGPQRRSIVSSRPTTSGPVGANAATSRPSSTRPTARLDHSRG